MLLAVQNLAVQFTTPDGIVDAVSDISFAIRQGETLCIVGESGCGKSVTAQAILRLIASPPGKIVSGKLLFDGNDLLALNQRQMQQIRGNDIAMVFQDPMTSLNPVFTIGFQLIETLRMHQGVSKKQGRERAIELLKRVHIPDAHKRIDQYPHELSGGMRQRVMIAIALACSPRLLIADEPTTALDVTIQAQILDLLGELKETMDMAVMFITHDLGIVAEIADSVLVLYAGKVAERGSAVEIFQSPRHPYTVGLLNSVPRMSAQQQRLHVIPGTLPDPTRYEPGCRFFGRCTRRSAQCAQLPPEQAVGASSTHSVACFHPHEAPHA
jgi:oligopeptide/dipeptide ABC transporter ATP-binding protein